MEEEATTIAFSVFTITIGGIGLDDCTIDMCFGNKQR